MSKQCPTCGSVNTEDNRFCCKCGNVLSQPTQPSRQSRQPYHPQQQYYQPRHHAAVANSFDIKAVARTIMRYISFILIGLTIFTLILTILNFTAAYKVSVKATGSGYGESMSESDSVKLSEILETEGTDAFEPLGFCTRAYGVFNLVLTVLSGMMVAKIFQGNRKIRRSVNTYALIGMIGSVVFLVFFWITGIYEMSMLGAKIKIVIHPHFTVWLSAVFFALLYALNFLTKKKRRGK